MTITRHEELALVLVSRRVSRSRLGRGGQTLKVKFVRVPLSMDLGHDVLVVVIPATGALPLVQPENKSLASFGAPGVLI